MIAQMVPRLVARETSDDDGLLLDCSMPARVG
jgi:hypothetical protein